MTITGYSRCQCGAITIITDQGDYSCKVRNLHKFFPGIDLRKLELLHEAFACNHCVNHYGPRPVWLRQRRAIRKVQ